MSAEILRLNDYRRKPVKSASENSPQPMTADQLFARAMVLSAYGTAWEAGEAWTAYYSALLGDWPIGDKPCDME